MWPSLIQKTKEGGIDVIQTYVFWNLHEPKLGEVGGPYYLISLCEFSKKIGFYIWSENYNI